ncbi:MAG: hypothetical protein LBG21_03870 [Campylobacteraceae bacterium]|jgi:hypothetical protein|nr:hypothetical protein [Campylobacteraceae bacterium]
MKRVFSVIFVLFFVFNQNAYSISKKELACEAIMCLSTPKSVSGCQVALAYYYGINAWTLGAVIAARIAFLSLCKEYKGDVRNIVINNINNPTATDNPGSTGGVVAIDNTDTSASTTYSDADRAGTTNGLNDTENDSETSDYGYDSYDGYGGIGFGNGGSGSGGGGGGYSGGGSDDEEYDNDNGNFRVVGNIGRAKNSDNNTHENHYENHSEDDEPIDSNGDGIFDTTVGKLKLKCKAEELNKLQDYTKTKIRTTVKLPEYCNVLLEHSTVVLPVYICDQEFYYMQDWSKGHVEEQVDIEKYKAWKDAKGNGRTKISEDGTTITYTIYKPIKKECWVESTYDIVYNINEEKSKSYEEKVKIDEATIEEADLKITNIKTVFDADALD